MIISRTPFRISFFGGGTDYPAWYLKNSGSVLTTTIDKYSYISCRYLPPFFNHKNRIVYSKVETTQTVDEIQHPAVRAVLKELNQNSGLEIHYDGDLPARSGLGSSSAFTVGLINAIYALEGKLITKEGLAKKALHIEQEVIKEVVGSQDQIAAAFGGFNHIKFFKDNTFDVIPVEMSKDKKSELQKNLMLCFTGFSRFASDIAKTKIDNFDKKESELKAISHLVSDALKIVTSESAPLDDFGKLLHETWMLKQTLSTSVSNDQINEIYTAAKEAGAIGGKLLGAGGGGFMVFYVKPENQERVRNSLNKLIHVKIKFDSEGSKIIVNKPSI